jgi:hypothetical protein
MGICHNHDPIFFYHKSSKISTDNAFGGVVTPSAQIQADKHKLTQMNSINFGGTIHSVSIGIIPMSLLDLCVNQRQSLVICG